MRADERGSLQFGCHPVLFPAISNPKALMDLRLTLLTLVYLAATAFPSHSAELERIVRSRLEVSVTPIMLPASKPAERRSLAIKLRNLLTGAAKMQVVEVATYWIGAGPPRTVLAVNRTVCSTSTGQLHMPNQDSGPQTARIEGWVVTARDRTSRELLAVKASSAALEALARTPGALPEEPGPVKETP